MIKWYWIVSKHHNHANEITDFNSFLNEPMTLSKMTMHLKEYIKGNFNWGLAKNPLIQAGQEKQNWGKKYWIGIEN